MEKGRAKLFFSWILRVWVVQRKHSGWESQEPVSFKHQSWAWPEQPGRASSQGSAVVSVSWVLDTVGHRSFSWDSPCPHRGPPQRATWQGTPRHRPGLGESTEVFPDPSSFRWVVSTKSGFSLHQKRITQIFPICNQWAQSRPLSEDPIGVFAWGSEVGTFFFSSNALVTLTKGSLQA